MPAAASSYGESGDGYINPECLEDIAFVLLSSDYFYFDEDLAAEIIHDWSQPRVNYPLTAENLLECRRWLLGSEVYPVREKPRATGKVVSVKRRVFD